jgi:hypothetical protein
MALLVGLEVRRLQVGLWRKSAPQPEPIAPALNFGRFNFVQAGVCLLDQGIHLGVVHWPKT